MENQKKTVNYRKHIFRETKEVYVSTNMDLPDYCPDIRRVLHCSGTPYTETVFSESEKASMDGMVLFRLLYTADDGSVHTYETEQRYNAAVRCGGVSATDVLFCTQKYESVRYRAVGPRRVEMNLVVSVQFEIDSVTEMSDITEESERIQRKQTESAGYSLQALATCPFVLEETFSPRNEKLTHAAVIAEQITPVQNEIKIVKDKILIKGTCEIEYRCLETESQTVFTANESVPFSQILSVPGVQEDDAVQIIFHAQHGTLTAHDSGECELRVQLIASVCAYRDSRIIAVTDAFSTLGDSTNEYETCYPIDTIISYSDSVSVNESEPITDESAEDEVKAVIADTARTGFKYEGDKIVLSGIIPTTVLLHGSSGWHAVHKDIPFSVNRAATELGNMTVYCSGWKQNVSCVKNADKLLLKADLNFSVFAVNEQEMKVVRNCQMVSDSDSSAGHIGLLFAEKGENLWEIAKENRIALASVRKVNDMDDSDTVPENMILLLTKQ